MCVCVYSPISNYHHRIMSQTILHSQAVEVLEIIAKSYIKLLSPWWGSIFDHCCPGNELIDLPVLSIYQY